MRKKRPHSLRKYLTSGLRIIRDCLYLLRSCVGFHYISREVRVHVYSGCEISRVFTNFELSFDPLLVLLSVVEFHLLIILKGLEEFLSD